MDSSQSFEERGEVMTEIDSMRYLFGALLFKFNKGEPVELRNEDMEAIQGMKMEAQQILDEDGVPVGMRVWLEKGDGNEASTAD